MKAILFLLVVAFAMMVIYLSQEDKRDQQCNDQNGVYLRNERRCLKGKEINLE